MRSLAVRLFAVGVFFSAAGCTREEAPRPQGQVGVHEVAMFGGGCFWGMERVFEQLEGVTDVVSGYAGGKGADPVYEDYASKGHTEVVRVEYDPDVVAYADLLKLYWMQVGAGCQLQPKGTAYRTVIFYFSDSQREMAERSKSSLQKSGLYPGPVVTEIVPAMKFYRAEKYHQDYHRKLDR